MRPDLATPAAIRTKTHSRVVLGDVVAMGKNLFARCRECSHGAIIVPAELTQRVGYDARLGGLGRRLRSSECGRKAVRLEPMEPGQGYS